MKKYLISMFACAAMFGLTAANAATLPAGWTELQSPDAATRAFANDANTAAVTITVAPTQGASLEAIANGFSAQLKDSLGCHAPEKDEDGSYTILCPQEGKITSMGIVDVGDGKFANVSMTATDEAALESASALVDAVSEEY